MGTTKAPNSNTTFVMADGSTYRVGSGGRNLIPVSGPGGTPITSNAPVSMDSIFSGLGNTSSAANAGGGSTYFPETSGPPTSGPTDVFSLGDAVGLFPNPTTGVVIAAQQNDYLNSLLEEQGVASSYPYGTLNPYQQNAKIEDMLDSIMQFEGQDESNQLAIQSLVAGEMNRLGITDPNAINAAVQGASQFASTEGATGLGAVGAAGNAVSDYIKDVIGGAADWFKETAGLVVLNPVTGTVQGTWNVPGSQPVIKIPGMQTIPGTNTTGAVTTGIPIIDAILDNVINQEGASPEEVRDIIESVIAGQTGIPKEVVSAGGAGIDEIVGIVKDASIAATNVDGGGGQVLIDLTEGTTGGTTTETPPVTDTTTPPSPPVTDVIIPGGLPEDPNIVLETPPGPNETPEETPPSPPLGLGAPININIPSQRTTQVDPAELVDLDYLYDVGGDSIFAPFMQEDEKFMINDRYRRYNAGGAVTNNDTLLAILAMLEDK